MMKVSAAAAAAHLDRLIDELPSLRQPIRIVGARREAMLVSATDWAAIQESVRLLSVPGLRDSLRDGIGTPIDRRSNRPGS